MKYKTQELELTFTSRNTLKLLLIMFIPKRFFQGA